jgi:hypothetical protein
MLERNIRLVRSITSHEKHRATWLRTSTPDRLERVIFAAAIINQEEPGYNEEI